MSNALSRYLWAVASCQVEGTDAHTESPAILLSKLLPHGQREGLLTIDRGLIGFLRVKDLPQSHDWSTQHTGQAWMPPPLWSQLYCQLYGTTYMQTLPSPGSTVGRTCCIPGVLQ